jgi:hypothetical protein
MEGADIKAIVAEYTDVTERRGPVRIAANRQTAQDPA